MNTFFYIVMSALANLNVTASPALLSDALFMCCEMKAQLGLLLVVFSKPTV